MAPRRSLLRRALFLALPVLVLAPLAGCAIVDHMSGVSEARALQEKGLPAEATIVEIWDTGMTVNNDPVVGFLLEVRPPDQTSFRAKTKLRISRLDLPRVQPGLVVPVRYDPSDLRRVALDIYDFRRHRAGGGI
jgi:hypothetical protein